MKRILVIIYLVSTFLTMSGQNVNIVLGRPTDNSITMNILFDAKVIFYIEHGTNSGNYSVKIEDNNSEANVPFVEKLTNLEADTRYYYRVNYRLPAETIWKVSPEYTFHTQRNNGKSFCFTIEADPHPYDKKCYPPIWETTLDNQLADHPDFMLDLGDTFGDDHYPFEITSAEVKQLHLNNRAFFGRICHSVPLFLCLGNHEGESGYYLLQNPPENLATWGTIWRKYYYPNPFPDEFFTGNTEEEPGIGFPENYYAWEWGDALFVVLDAYRYYTADAKPRNWEWTIGKPQYDWLKQTLENSTATFKFVFIHHVLGEARGGVTLANSFEWGGYEKDGTKWSFTENRPGWEMPIHQLLVKNKVSIFFQGHDHLFAREELNGIVYQTVPMPSDSSYSIGINDNGYAFTGTIFPGSGHLRVTVSPEQVQIDFTEALLPKDETVNVKNGDVVYSYAINKTGEISTSAKPATEKPNNNVQVFPNPFRDNLEICLNLSKAGNVTLYLFDAQGRQTGKTETGYLPAGTRTIRWQISKLKDMSLRNGMYTLKIVTPESSHTKNIVRLK